MGTIFEYNDRSFKAFSKFYSKAPQRARKATARLLSKFAYGTRQEAIREIKKTMTVRNHRFVSRQMRFTNARPVNIDQQVAGAGSIASRNFSGWEENFKGKADPRKRRQTLFSRGNTFKKKVKPSLRMKPSRNFTKESDYDLPKGKNRMVVYFQKIKTKNKSKPFIIKKKYKSMPAGLWKFQRNKPRLVQSFDPRKRNVKKNTWLTTARRRFFAKNSLEKLWKQSIDDLFRSRRF